MGAGGHDFAVTQVTGAVPFSRHDARAETTPNGGPTMFTSADFMFTASDFAKIARAPAVVLTLSFVGILFAYLSAASAFA
jgi:hypothetical protein